MYCLFEKQLIKMKSTTEQQCWTEKDQYWSSSNDTTLKHCTRRRYLSKNYVVDVWRRRRKCSLSYTYLVNSKYYLPYSC